MLSKIKEEKDLRELLELAGFETNHKKHKFENGVDVVAMKDGYVFMIEHKLAALREDGSYRIAGDITGDVLFISLPSGKWFLSLEGTSLTKTCRLMEMINV